MPQNVLSVYVYRYIDIFFDMSPLYVNIYTASNIFNLSILSVDMDLTLKFVRDYFSNDLEISKIQGPFYRAINIDVNCVAIV